MRRKFSPQIDRLRDIASLMKPRLTTLVVLTALAGWALAPSDANTSWVRLVFAMLGVVGVVGAANALNCYLEKDVDALMERTKDRPLVTGRMHPNVALVFGIGLSFVSLLTLFFFGNLLTAVLGFMGFSLYVVVYTPLKRQSMLALFAGAVPGAIPPMMGWAAKTGSLDVPAWVLFGILFFWQLPHFLAISLFRKDEYVHAGLKTVPGSLGAERANQHMLAYTGLLVAFTFLPFILGQAGFLYLVVSLFIGLAFVSLCVASFFRMKDLNWSRLVFFASLLYLPMVLGVWVLDQHLHGGP